MKKTTQAKLTPAQTQAAVAKADRRAAAAERAASPTLRANDLRVAAMWGNAKVAPVKKTKKVTAKRVAWTSEEYDFIIGLYLKHVNPNEASDNRVAIEVAFTAQYPERSIASIHFTICRIKNLDAYYPAEGMSDLHSLLIDKLYAADPVRFPGGATKEDKIVNALDNLLAEIRG